MTARSLEGDALAEAAAWLDVALGAEPIPPLIVTLGAGAGHVLEVLEQRAPDTRVLVLEPDRAAAAACLSRRDWSQRRDSGRLAYLVGPDYAGADRAWRVFPKAPDAFKLLVHPDAARDRQQTMAALAVFKRIQFGVKANAIARRKFAPRYLANVIRNTPAMAAGHDVRALAGVFRGIPAVIAAAGPSLDRAIDELREASGRAVLIAVDTALRPLLHAGLQPQLVVGADPGAANARHFHALPACPHTWLVSESALDRSATSLFDGRTFWFRLARHHPWPWLQEAGLDVGHLEMWGSVLTAAFQVAVLAGCDPIVLVGSDLAFTDGRPYARGTTYEFDWARDTSRGSTLDAVWAAQMSRSQMIQVPDLHGRETVGTTTLQAFRDWMLAASARSGRRVINATGAGTLFGKGIEQLSLKEALGETPKIPVLDGLAHEPTSSVALSRVADRIRGAEEALRAHGASARPLADWAEFLEDGYQPAAIEKALQSALNELDGRMTRASFTLDWSAPHTRDLLTRLPETLASCRLLLASGERSMTAASPGTERVLAESFELLRRIAESAGRLRRLPFASNPPQIGRVPVSGLFAWPDQLRWSVAVFEAMLHGIWPPAEDVTGFLTRPVRLRDTASAPADARVTPRRDDHAGHACLLLALEWLRCAHESHGEAARLSAAVSQTIAAVAAASARAPYARATLGITLRTASSPAAVEIAVPVATPAFVRHLTGMLGDHRDAHELVSVQTDAVGVSIVLRPGGADGAAAAPAIPRSRKIAPRVLTDEGVAGALVMYRCDEGAACVLFQRHESVMVDSRGAVRPLHRWPRPIVGELPFGTDGAIAWGDGLSGYPDRVEGGYVMYKPSRDGEIVIQDLPVRPTIGRWWHDRIYWNCHPRRVESPTGLVSWSPGDAAPRQELPDLPATLGMFSDEHGLRFETGGGPLQGGRWVRRFAGRGWLWRPGAEPDPIQLGPDGAAASRETHQTWTATSFPEADLIRLESSAGRHVAIACYYPLGLAWTGDSLLVNTIEQELLLFENLATRLGRM